MYNIYNKSPRVISIEYSAILERLAHHRKRTGLTKADFKRIIKARYATTFKRLNDYQLLNFGMYLKSLPDKP